MSLDGKPDKNNKGNSGETKDSLVDSISFMSKQFNWVLKRFEKRSRNHGSRNAKESGLTSTRQLRPQISKKEANKSGSNNNQYKGKTFWCREYEGYGHFQSKCPNFLKRQNKSYVWPYMMMIIMKPVNLRRMLKPLWCYSFLTLF